MINSHLNKLLDLKALGPELKQVYEAISNDRDCLVYSAAKAHKAHIASKLDRFVLYVVKDTIEESNALTYLQSFYGNRVGVLKGNDDLLIHRKTSSRSNVGSRSKVLKDILDNKIDCCIISSQELLQYFARPNKLKDAFISLKVGDNVDVYDLINKLTLLGYTREEAVEEKSTFTLKGDILSIFCSDMDMPVRISLFDTEIESIKKFEPESLLSVGEIDSVAIAPNNDFLWDKDEIEEGVTKAQKEIDRLSGEAYNRATEIVNTFAYRETCGQDCQWLIPFLTKKMASIFSYLPRKSVIVFDDPIAINEQLNLIEHEHQSRVKVLAEDGSVLRAHNASIRTISEVKALLNSHTVLGFANAVTSNMLFKVDEIIKVPATALSNYHVNYETLLDDLRSFLIARQMVVICCGDKYKAERMVKHLESESIYCKYQKDIEEHQPGIFVTPIDLVHGFVYPKSKIVLIGREDIYKTYTPQKKSKTGAFTMPSVGDYVVHEVHGIGRCLGTQRMKTDTSEQDYVVVEYKNGGKLYVPMDQLDRLSRYSGSDSVPRLSTIGGQDFAKVKANVKKSVKDMAINLLELYSKRQQKRGYKYPEDTIWQKELEESFEFEETPDQLEAIKDAKADMERGVIMDRLLCGDVGYGKTEVALRIVFKTIMENKQAVILAPTTILAKQHYYTAMERFNQFGIKVELLTRFQSASEIKASLENLESGKSLVAVATHRILSSDVHFHDLGLLVLDEEQRFGVEHKEKLKALKNNVNVLTMSATPIPRTLNMAMSGIRDMSVLETPPRNRLPVQTSVTELTPGLLQDAIGRELNRGGQVFILFNRVQGIKDFADEVQAAVPEAKVVYAHGQMNSVELENRVNKFYNQEANVLVCTTIIENGIDIPNANTLIVCEADRLGLSQLYQLRGRVGRSNRIAYAYFTVRPGKVLTSDSYKRLSAIMDYTELGSGFKIAMRDLEIRGAGNILGKEQHGHIQKVGYDMYCKLLRECIAELQGEKVEEESDIKLNFAISAYIDKEFMPSENSRIRVYREVSTLASIDEYDKLYNRIKEYYGKPPKEIVNLLNLGLIKNLAKQIGVCEVDINSIGCGLTFKDASVYKNENVIKAVSDMKDDALMTVDEKPRLIFNSKKQTNAGKLRIIKEFLLKSSKRIG